MAKAKNINRKLRKAGVPVPSRNTAAKQAAKKAKSATTPEAKQAALVERAKATGRLGAKAKGTMKDLAAKTNRTPEEDARLTRLRERRAAARGARTTRSSASSEASTQASSAPSTNPSSASNINSADLQRYMDTALPGGKTLRDMLKLNQPSTTPNPNPSATRPSVPDLLKFNIKQTGTTPTETSSGSDRRPDLIRNRIDQLMKGRKF